MSDIIISNEELSINHEGLKKVIDNEKELIAAMIDRSKKSKKKDVYMSFGKYKGKLLKDVISFDERYCRWVYKQDFTKQCTEIYRILHEHFSNV